MNSDRDRLDAAIQHAIEVAKDPNTGPACAREHAELANWLGELRFLRGNLRPMMAQLKKGFWPPGYQGDAP